ncbi:MAG: hypothetical protein ACNI3A_08665 [Desulfovibrio sp.]|uniref:hypothetical protein n=1 Tax=Desulfovibrio sp. 7SRBS1 TaxID=3378064 RepID=UPI003B419C01
MEKEKTIIELDPADSAFVLRGNGSHDIYLENLYEGDDEASEEMYLVVGLSIAFVKHRNALRAFVDQVMEAEGEEVEPKVQ